MTASSTRQRATTARKAAQIAALTPVVAGARMMRIASTGRYDDLNRMAMEKASAFTASAIAMTLSGIAAYARSVRIITEAWTPGRRTASDRMAALRSTFEDASAGMSGAAIAPIHRRVVANARRIGR